MNKNLTFFFFILLLLSYSLAWRPIAQGTDQYMTYVLATGKSHVANYEPSKVDFYATFNFNYNLEVDDADYVNVGAVCPNATLKLTLQATNAQYYLANVNNCIFNGDPGIDLTGFTSGARIGSSSTTYAVDMSISDINNQRSDLGLSKNSKYPTIGSTSNMRLTAHTWGLCNAYHNTDENANDADRNTGNAYIAFILGAVPSFSVGGNIYEVSTNPIEIDNLKAPSSPQNPATFRYTAVGIADAVAVTYMKHDSDLDGADDDLYYNAFSNGSFKSMTSHQYTIQYNVRNRNSSIQYIDHDPHQMSDTEQTILVNVTNPGDVPMKPISASATNGYEISSFTTPTINPGEQGTIEVVAEMTDVSQGNFNISIEFQPLIQDCEGKDLPNRNITFEMTIPIPDLYPTIEGDDFIIEPDPDNPNGNTTHEYNGVIHINPDVGRKPFNATLTIIKRDENGASSTYFDGERLFQRDGSGNYIWPFNVTCNNSQFTIYDVLLVADPEHSVEETNYDNNEVRARIVCLGPLTCEPLPSFILLMPGFGARSDIFCGYNVEKKTPMICSEEPDVKQDANYTELSKVAQIFEGIDETAYLGFLGGVDMLTMPEGSSKSYILSLTIPDQQRTIKVLNETGDEVEQEENFDYTCKVNVTVYNAPCTYYI